MTPGRDEAGGAGDVPPQGPSGGEARGTSGAAGAGTDEAAGAGTDEVVYRDVRWRRSASGRMMWFNEGLRRWVLWKPGSDAPPVPAGWGGGASDGQPGEGDTPDADPGVRQAGSNDTAAARPGLLRYLPSDAMSRRPPLRSPYRIVPIVIAVLIVAVAVYQATRPPDKATKQDIAAAEALKGDCLSRDGGNVNYPDFAATPVSCSAKGALGRVVKVVMPGPKASCPPGTVATRVLEIGLAGEPVECVEPVRH